MLSGYAEQLRQICVSAERDLPGYVLRTRVERILYGMLLAICKQQTGTLPAGLNRKHLQAVLPGAANRPSDPADTLAWDIVRAFEDFTYLSDTSNQSNDGQGLRLDRCYERFIAICGAFDATWTESRRMSARVREP
jgi:hypothetical protein